MQPTSFWWEFTILPFCNSTFGSFCICNTPPTPTQIHTLILSLVDAPTLLGRSLSRISLPSLFPSRICPIKFIIPLVFTSSLSLDISARKRKSRAMLLDGDWALSASIMLLPNCFRHSVELVQTFLSSFRVFKGDLPFGVRAFSI